MTREELLLFAKTCADSGDDCSVFEKDREIVEFLLDNCEITVPEENRYFVNVNCEGITGSVISERAKKFACEIEQNGLTDGEKSLAYTGAYDFGHTTTEWETVIGLGIAGLKQRIDKYAELNGSNEKKPFYNSLSRVYAAALRFTGRAADAALACGKTEMSDGLANLTKRCPGNLFEALQTSLIYYTLQHFVDGTNLRTLGRVDRLYYPYYEKENPEKANRMIGDYIKEIDRLHAAANIPFALGGADICSSDTVNPLSYVFLDAYRTAQTTNTKLHFLYTDNMPADIIEQAFRCVRNGNNSIVFMSDKKITQALEKSGAEHNDAVNYHVVGCYECGAENELTCSCNARVNIPKALEFALNNGKDMLSGKQTGLACGRCFTRYEELYEEFIRQLDYLCNCAMKATNLWEKHYKSMHSSPILSGVYRSSLEKGGDLYCDYSAKYNNSSLNAIGLATAADSLAAVKKIVFEDKTMTLDQLAETLKSDWQGQEYLRLTVKNKFPKFGTGDPGPDNIAKDIVRALSLSVSGKPNSKGGVFRLGLFSIDWRWGFGEKTAASADGRKSGQPLSQNTSASFGADTKGATAHLLSVSRIDASDTPNGAIADIDLHASAATGENGIKALSATLRTYFDLGGFAVHYNILDTEILKDAKRFPDKYPSLQVRLCGWNVLFSSLSDREKDEFIARSMK